jgi:hypothetical protein
MTLDQALNNVSAACAAFKGNLEEHKALQESIKLLQDLVSEKKLASQVPEK